MKWLEYDFNTYFRTPSQRCKEEFENLFTIMYNTKYTEGLKLKPNKTVVTVNYNPASMGLPRPITKKFENVPDLTRLTSHLEQFRKIASICEDELDAYSRFLGRKPDEHKSVSALALLPKELFRQGQNKTIEALNDKLRNVVNQNECTGVDVNYLLELLSIEKQEKLSKSDTINIIQLLEKLGVGIEPDLRFGGPLLKVNEKAVMFKLIGNYADAPTKEYSATQLIVTMSTVLSVADGNISDEEKKQIIEHVESSMNLTKEEKTRLTAYMNWASLSMLDMKGLNKKLTELDEKQRSNLAKFLITVVNADGYISPDEIKTLKKVYNIFAFDENRLYSDIHSIQTLNVEEIPTIIPADEKREGYKIPKQKKVEGSVVLNEGVVERTLKDTHEIQKILTGIFVEEEVIATTPQEPKNSTEDQLLDLDSDHSGLLKELLRQEKWKRSEFEDLCSRIGLLPDGALENINEAFYSKFTTDFLVDGDFIEVNTTVFDMYTDILQDSSGSGIMDNQFAIQDLKKISEIYKLSNK